MDNNRQRIVFLDWLRAAACLMVLLVHACECVYSNDYSFSIPSETARWTIGLIQGFVRPVAVPLFLMASAYLLVPVTISTGEFLRKRFVRVAVPFVVFLFLYAFLPALWGEFTWMEAWANVKQAGINFIPRESHLWFVYMLLGLYLIMPVISPWLQKVSKKEEEFFLVLWAFTLCLYLFRYFFGPIFGECWWNPYPFFYYVSGFVGYIVLGHYIKEHVNWSARKTFSICIPILIACYAFQVWRFYQRSFMVDTPAELEMHLQNDTILAGIMSACTFLLFRCIKTPGRAYGMVKSISKASYGMYLMHMLMLPAIFHLLIRFVTVPFAIIFTALLTYTASWCISFVIGKLTFGKYIVG